MFTKSSPNTIVSDEGWQVKLLGRSGILYSESARSMKIDSEVLSGTAGLAVYSYSIQRWLPPNEQDALDDADKTRIIDNLRRAFHFEGFEINVY